MKITNFNLQFNKDNIFRFIDCYPESPIYEEVLEEYHNMEQEAYHKIHPAAVLAFGEISQEAANENVPMGTPVLFSITTIGDEISAWSKDLFENGDYLAGMLADAFADDYLMQASESLNSTIRTLCEEREMGITKRLEAPTGIGMEVQKLAYDITEAASLLHMSVKSSYMYEPVKSLCQVYLLDHRCKEYHMEHNCRECDNKTCKMRKVEPVKINVLVEGKCVELYCNEEQSLLELFRVENIYVPAVCAGRGSCGKCRIRVLEGDLSISESDKKAFSQNELTQGWRLACTAYPNANITIALGENQEDKMEILGTRKLVNKQKEITDGAKMIGIDIGTTTIAMELLDLETGNALDNYLTINKQRRFGADVISRMQASVEGKSDELKKSICQDLLEGICQVTGNGTIVPEKIVIAGNTTMEHLLMGFPCNTLGVYPFTPYRIDTITGTMEDVFGIIDLPEPLQHVPVILMPGISTFVGADIVSDILVCGMANTDRVSFLIDLGTNGEMAIGNKEKILVTSTAAGPAFEGGNIIHGIGSIPGAICNVKIEGEQVNVKTIQDKAPTGICGTGVIETLHELIQAGYLDETGLMDEEYLETGFPLAERENGEKICCYQKDIRELQLAKAAVRAGLETLLLRYGVTASEVEKVYLAGGFGYHMDVEKAIGIGLLPGEFVSKIEVIGNGSLHGALVYGSKKEAEQEVEKIVALSEEVSLSSDKDFNELYMEHMYFE